MPDKSDRITKILDHLRLIAQHDGEYTEEEQVFIDKARRKLHEYDIEFTLTESTESPMERIRLFKNRMAILNELIQTAEEDKHISDDEQDLIDEVKKLLYGLN